MRVAVTALCIAMVVLASCGGDDEPGGDEPGGAGADSSKTANIDPCALLTDTELTAVLGEAPTP